LLNLLCAQFILGLPMLNSTVAFGAVISISTIGLYISCAPPCHALHALAPLASLRCLLKVHVNDSYISLRLLTELLPQCADGIPIVVRLLNHKAFQPGPFYLVRMLHAIPGCLFLSAQDVLNVSVLRQGKIGMVIGWIGVGWCTVITVRRITPLPLCMHADFPTVCVQ
jgi:hypothetical protein